MFETDFPEDAQDPYAKAFNRVIRYAESREHVGYGKFDALNSPLVKGMTLNSKWLRLLASQVVKMSPVNIRPMLGVKKHPNPKGFALFAQAYINYYRITQDAAALETAISLLDWLLEDSCSGYSGSCWGYHWDWQDLGFYAPFRSPNCVVSCFVCQALLDGYDVTNDERYLSAAGSCAEFILNDLVVLHEDKNTKCISYVPDPAITMRVMDVSILAAALLARLAVLLNVERYQGEAQKFTGYVVSRQTEYGAWYYTDPPGASPRTHDNYHTGFILDALRTYQEFSGDNQFHSAYKEGMLFYVENLFCRDGAPKWTDTKVYPFDSHGAGTAIGVLSKTSGEDFPGHLKMAEKVADWAIHNMQADAGYFYYQKGRFFTKKFTLMRWCNAWMAHGLSYLLAERAMAS